MKRTAALLIPIVKIQEIRNGLSDANRAKIPLGFANSSGELGFFAHNKWVASVSAS